MEDQFMSAGNDGAPDVPGNIWRKGVVFTVWVSSLPPPQKPRYRISVGFKRPALATDHTAGFHSLYDRVVSTATQRVSELVAPDPMPPASIVSHGWRFLGDTANVATAFITLAISPNTTNNDLVSEAPPSIEELRSPGGTSLEKLTELARHHPDELYSEFDFTDTAGRSSSTITVSYAESIPEIPEDVSFNFKPTVDRAETFAKCYHRTLERLGEISSPFQVLRREWFLVDRKLVTIHIFLSP